jgi:hypothetical protein
MPESVTVTLEAMLGLFLVGAVWLAFFGPPPPRRGPAPMLAVVGLASTPWILILSATRLGAPPVPTAVILGIFGICCARWLARLPRGEEPPEDDDGPDGGDDPGPPPPDWDTFDRMRREWDRPKVPS